MYEKISIDSFVWKNFFSGILNSERTETKIFFMLMTFCQDSTTFLGKN